MLKVLMELLTKTKCKRLVLKRVNISRTKRGCVEGIHMPIDRKMTKHVTERAALQLCGGVVQIYSF